MFHLKSEFCGLSIRDIEFSEMRIKVDHRPQRASNMKYVIQVFETESGNATICKDMSKTNKNSIFKKLLKYGI